MARVVDNYKEVDDMYRNIQKEEPSFDEFKKDMLNAQRDIQKLLIDLQEKYNIDIELSLEKMGIVGKDYYPINRVKILIEGMLV